MDPKELKDNFTAQLEKAQNELNQLRQALAQREALVLKLQGAVEAMTIQLPDEDSSEGVEEVPLVEPEVA
jgi:predicted  nucleic acid-binding Zn-ribbon protein